MGKSSSKKLKHSKEDPSSKLRSVKKKKKTKRSKSKKIRQIKDSSSSDESESDSSLYSSSSSEDEYRREKHRRSKLSKKKKKKRSRKRYSSSSESDDNDEEDDDIRVLKKKKRSKRKEGTKKKKNKRIVSRKRRKREPTSSSTSSDEGSESNVKRMSSEKEWEEDDECWQVEDEVMAEKQNSKRLKSIVVVPYNYDNDERKEDMIVGDESDENMIVDDQRDGEGARSSPITDGHYNRRTGYDEFEEHHSSETSKASDSDNSLKGDDLEAILKKRALENLKRFRGETQKNETVRKDSGGETLQPESEIIKDTEGRPLMEQNLCVSEGDKDLETSERMLQVVNVKESGIGLADSVSQQDQQSGETARVKAGTGISSCTTKRRLIRPVLGQESSNLASRKEAAGCQDAVAENINGKSCPENSLALATKNGGENIEPTKVTSTSSSHDETETLDENKGESQSEQKTNDETKGDSQYEQKTMTVMRGGEMVQVSYKVYIPKKTSSLGRRQLRR
ncbi:unnamed protein product [Eruca vesicaria subsp. sativa]|uniref:Uncharacterized protein n=1 Tax=Eruca vesicaria subsp. sativa TaxID=29727 RepID=A0ABC8KN82_ERUVS|nr:unnamed protein product [Eruca vesicaria subsp. sativa]